MFELIGLYRRDPVWGQNAGSLFEGVIGLPTSDWDQARQTAQEIMALTLDQTFRPLRIRIRPAQPANI